VLKAIFLVVVVGLSWAAPAGAVTLDGVIDGDQRSAEQKARDQYRHPLKTLRFFDIRPDMTVVEILPTGGWYTSILAPYLRENGTYYAAMFPADYARTHAKDPDAAYWVRGRNSFIRDFVNHEDTYGPIRLVDLGPDGGKIVPDGTADLVLTFRNVHNWMAQGQAEAVFEQFYAALKPGGILGVVEHRAADNATPDPKATSGYVRTDQVVKFATEAGFRLVGQSEANANPHDTKNYPEGVWTLPPGFALGDEDRARYAAIGESDRMTLKFIKPGGIEHPDTTAQQIQDAIKDLNEKSSAQDRRERMLQKSIDEREGG
jgi:predicted methyltransferase